MIPPTTVKMVNTFPSLAVTYFIFLLLLNWGFTHNGIFPKKNLRFFPLSLIRASENNKLKKNLLTRFSHLFESLLNENDNTPAVCPLSSKLFVI